MAKDATPDKIKLVNDNFANENHEKLAGILQDEWGASTKFTDLGDDYDAHRATFQTVYDRYFGVPESLFNDGIVDSRTINQIKDDHRDDDKEKGAMNIYLDLREHRNLEPDAYHGVEYIDDQEPDTNERLYTAEEVMEIAEERFEKGFQSGFEAGVEAGQ